MRTTGLRAPAWGLAALLSVVMLGCAVVRGGMRPVVSTAAGRLEMDAASARRLQVITHGHRRDGQGRLVVSATLRNASEDVFKAKVKVKFASADGLLERNSFDTVTESLAAGETTFEWTSATPDAQSYVVELRSPRWFQW